MKAGRVALLASAALVAVLAPAAGSLYWNAGVRTNPIRVCFVGDALTSRPLRVQQVRDYISRFSHAANIDFTDLGTCPAPTQKPDGNDFHAGDIRVVLPDTSVDATRPLQGKGCENDSLSSAPDAVSWGPDRIDIFWRGWDGTLRQKAWDGKAWSGTFNHGGTLTSGPAVASWDVNRLAVFARGPNNDVMQKRWTGSAWEDWKSIGGSVTSDPAAVSRGGDRLDVFARGEDDAIWQNAWDGSSWSGWVSRGGKLSSAPAVASWGMNRMDLFARGMDNAIWHKSWNGSSWTGWVSLGGSMTSEPAAVSWGAGRIDVFARGQDGSLQQNAWTGSAWSGWLSLGGNLASGPGVASWGTDRLDIFYEGQNTALWTRAWASQWFGHADLGDNNNWGSWSHAPSDLETSRSCLYNLKLGDDGDTTAPYLNHTLHEFGHALGLSHEHVRSDVDKTLCSEPGYGGGATSGFLTPYDRDSVMHYAFFKCGINGNYGHSGLSHYDRLALHILYPEDDRVAELQGTTVIPSTASLKLGSDWGARGANLGFVASGWSWKIGPTVHGTSPDLNVKLPPGIYTLTLQHKDFLNRSYAYTGTVRVLPPGDYDRLMAGVRAALSPL